MQWWDFGKEVIQVWLWIPFLVLHLLQVFLVHRSFVQGRTVSVDDRVVDVDWDQALVDVVIDGEV